MATPLDSPKLRHPIDIRLERLEQQEVLIVSCPLGISVQPLVLNAVVGPILGHFEGNLSVDEITARFAAYGLRRETVIELVALLDQHLFLATPRFFTAERAARESFLASPVRPAALAGTSYAGSRAELQREIDSYLALGLAPRPVPERPMIGLISPHIDYRRGHAAYGRAWPSLGVERHDLYLVLGTAHQYSRHMFHLTRKDFETPLGRLRCDQDFVASVAARYGEDRSFADELLHRREHSLELQLPFLKRLSTDVPIVPVLVGGFHHLLASGRLPEEDEQYESFAGALAEVLRTRRNAGSRICFISGVDMAHVGRSFGDSGSLTPEFMDEIRERDEAYLAAITAGDRRALYAHIAEDNDARRICGFPTMYLVLDLCERLGLRCETRILDYRQAVDYQRDCAVTFAGAAMYARAPGGAG